MMHTFIKQNQQLTVVHIEDQSPDKTVGLFIPVLDRVRMLDGCLSAGELKPDIQPPKSLLISWMS